MEKTGKIIVIVAPSGTGKSTLIKRLKKACPELLESVSYTTRKIREGEVDGVHYNFITKENFLAMKDAQEFLEWAQVHGNYYGTSKKFVEKQLLEGKSLLFDLDVQGTDSFKTYFKDSAKVIFIAPPSVETLQERLLGRGTETEESLKLRLSNALGELKRKDDFDYCVINDELERAYQELLSIVKGILG
ncbi:guanylate kinase [Bacteriovorax sp. Seq25_V]|uniref:guanylate kinase n=1 Tax=Bacteriovorax sp. Seq25_V TaxID=1201288 RepID=UPI00038A14B0|nr:guanylate kinase [Bacteriovorax sp. Seq25_V]EQC47327.1 guanylate kinase [Bacteriovorax sp. Seq25_V]